MNLEVRDKVSIVDSKGKSLAQGVIININDFREPSMMYAVDVDDYEDVLFFGESHLVKMSN